jgi:hypothetical protein
MVQIRKSGGLLKLAQKSIATVLNKGTKKEEK